MRPVVLCLIACTAAMGGEAITGYRGDRNGSYPGCTPPIVWDEASGKNLAWKTELPNWCYGQPIVVGQKVFVMSEFGWKSDFPELVCLDLGTGKILWTREINHLEAAIPDAKRRAQIAAGWSSLLERMRAAFTLVDESWSADPTDTAKIADFAKRAEALGSKLEDKYGRTRIFGNQRNGGGYGVLRGWGAGKHPGPDPQLGVSLNDLRDVGLRLETFYGFGPGREGGCFPTPVSDGTSVYVVTDHGAHVSFDLDGKQRWLTWIPRDHRGTGGHDDSLCRSPVVVDGLFITDLHMDNENTRKKPTNDRRLNAVNALDTATGRIVWQVPLPMEGSREHGCGSSKVMEVGGVQIFITAGGHVLRVKDGQPLLTCAYSAKEDPCNGQTEIATDDATDTFFYYPGAGQKSKNQLAAVRLAMEGGALTEKELWRATVRLTGHTMVVHEGKIYTGGDTVDTATGAVASWGDKPRSTTRWLVAVAANRLYSLKSSGEATVFDLSGKQLAVNKVVTETSDPELIARHIAISGRSQFDYSYSAPFTIVGNRLLMRSYDHLYCFAGK